MSVMRKLIQRNNSGTSGFDKRFEYLIPDYQTRPYKGKFVYHDSSASLVPWEYSYLDEELRSTFDRFEDVQFTLFFSADQSAPYFDKWIQSSVPLKIWMGINDTIWDNPLSFFDASSEFWRNGRDVLNYGDLVSMFRNGDCDNDFSWRFMFDNAPFVYGKAYDEGTSDYTIENTRRIQILLQVSWIILGVMGGMVLISGFFFIRPSVNAIFREVDMVRVVLLLFLILYSVHCCFNGGTQIYSRSILCECASNYGNGR